MIINPAYCGVFCMSRRLLNGWVVIIAGLVIVFSGVRLLVFRFVLNKAVISLESRYGVQLAAGQPRFAGLSGLRIRNFVLTHSVYDTIVKIEEIAVSVQPWSVIDRPLHITAIVLSAGMIDVQAIDSIIRFKKPETIRRVQQDNRQLFPYLVVGQFIRCIPGKINVSDFFIRSGNHESLFIKQITGRKHNIQGSVLFISNKDTSLSAISGYHRRGSLQIQIRKKTGQLLFLPFVESRFEAKTGFDSLFVSLEALSKTIASEQKYILKLSGFNGRLDHPLISQYPVRVDSVCLNFSLRFNASQIEMDSISWMGINAIRFPVYCSYTSYPEKVITFKIPQQKWDAGHFFASLPAGIFETVRYIKARGDLIFTMNFCLPIAMPDSIDFSMSLSREKFTIIRWGKRPLDFIKDTFTYTVFTENAGQQNIRVNPDDPAFCPFNEIAPVLVNAVLTSEDGGYWLHRGFHPEAFRKSIAVNIKEKRFARGGSTITMQLVKNIFLSRNKTISRKAEEALIVWLIETLHLVSKERMLEVYFNIIEWGPGVYGIRAASDFYFKKKPHELTLDEAVFLASILPNPRRFRFTFGDDLKSKPFFIAYRNLIIKHMLSRGYITENDTVSLKPFITLTGIARDYLTCSAPAPCDTVISDSTLILNDLFNVFK